METVLCHKSLQRMTQMTYTEYAKTMLEGLMPFGDILQRLRMEAGLSQADLAEKAGLSARSIQNWEQGHRAPRARPLMSLASALGVSVETLLADELKPAKKAKKK